jgi:hypothetical protein
MRKGKKITLVPLGRDDAPKSSKTYGKFFLLTGNKDFGTEAEETGESSYKGWCKQSPLRS